MHNLPHDWPSARDVEQIVPKSSGQFVYAATVLRYIGHASTVPGLGLQWVQQIIPHSKNSPFTHLDSIYSFILSQVNDFDMARAVLSMHVLQQDIVQPSTLELLHGYGPHTKVVIESCVAEMAVIVRPTQIDNVEFYHAFMKDFLLDRPRSGIYWLDIKAFGANVLESFWTRKGTYLL